MEGSAENKNREIWRETPNDYYSPSIYVTSDGLIGISAGGYVAVKSAKEWNELAWTKERKEEASKRNREQGRGTDSKGGVYE